MKDFFKTITEQITVPSIANYGEIGTYYFVVLVFENGEFRVIGSFLYRIFREGLYTTDDLINFGKECELYRVGKRAQMPCWCYKEKGLTFEDK